jgi:hypothetical protein
MQGNEGDVSLRLLAKKSVQQAAATQIACMAGRETNPTSAGPKGFIAFVLHLFDAR